MVILPLLRSKTGGMEKRLMYKNALIVVKLGEEMPK
jgi:hypothetical protein